MSDNFLDLLKTLITVLVPVGVLWVKMYFAERRREREEAARENVRNEALAKVASKAEDVANTAVEAATLVKQVAVDLSTDKVDVKQNHQETKEQLNTLVEGQQEAAVVLDKVHVLSNNNMQIQLELNKLVSDRLAIADPTEENIAAAAESKRALDEHIAKQQKVDAKEEKDVS